MFGVHSELLSTASSVLPSLAHSPEGWPGPMTAIIRGPELCVLATWPLVGTSGPGELASSRGPSSCSISASTAAAAGKVAPHAANMGAGCQPGS